MPLRSSSRQDWEKITQIVVTVGAGLHQNLKQYAKDEDTTLTTRRVP